MPVVDVMNLEGKKVGQLDLADDVFAAKINQNLLHEAVRHHLAGERAGTHKTKDKSEVSGSGKKLWKQKGTGRARVGSIRSSIWRKGGTVHGPVPRSYAYRLPRKMVLGALRRLIPAHGFVQQVGVHLRPKNRVGQVHLANVLACKILDVHYRHCRRILEFRYFVRYSFRYFALRALRIRM